MPTVLIAPDKFKGSLSAAEVAAALSRGIAATSPDARTDLLPIADGGDGTVEAALVAGFTAHEARIAGPTGEPITARWAQSGTEAVLELAETSGLRRLPGDAAGRTLLDHARASTRGLGELILAARDAGAAHLVIGLGGSASTDGGAGLLAALGARLLDGDGTPIPDGHDGLAGVASADLGPALAALEGVHLEAACDVTNPLLGPDGAAAVFGPQKGLADADIRTADEILGRWADAVEQASTGPSAPTPLRERPGAGAAGGTGFALYALGADFVSGADAVLDLLGFDAALARADVVITGEGRLDRQTLSGKGPAEVARRAADAGARVIAVAGSLDLAPDELEGAGIDLALDLLSRARDVEDAMDRTAQLLEDVGREIGEDVGGEG
ncbi:glycerate kinase [Brachybacterium halotolerans subsp. kimchii]|uniref:glycerate kinase n=1 Tax=Brachybacterium halotolerans TaxID=2795215 RepID=UPI001E3FF8A0|nr:glycerate kinase [Brachybacterium halotolerans]UEJ82683.1 glycerate kinase [Brachybacterium halotolerans subsp. kimchii]